MADTFYPSIKNIINIDSIPEVLSFIKAPLAEAAGSIFYRNLQFVDKGYEGYYEMDILPGVLLNIDLFGTGLKLVFDPSKNITTDGESVVHVTMSYSWSVLRLIDGFSTDGFSYAGEELLNLFYSSVSIPERQQLAISINIFEGGETYSAICCFVDKVNTQYSLTGTSAVPYPAQSEDYETMIDALNLSLTSANITDNLGTILTIQDIIGDLYFDISNVNFLDNLKLYSQAIIQQPLMDYVRELITPHVDGSINISLGLLFPRKWLVPVDDSGNVLPEPSASVVEFNIGKLFFSTTNGISFDENASGTLTKSQIANTGIIVGFSNAKLDLSSNRNILEADLDGRPDNFMGVYAESASITLPKKWFSDNSGETSTLEIAGSNLLIGTGGLSGTIALNAINGGTIGAKDYLWKNIGGNNGFVK